MIPADRPQRIVPSTAGVLAALLVAGLLGAAGCGGEPADDAARAALEGPPRWRGVQEEGPAGDAKLALQCRSPSRVRFRLELPDGGQEESPWRVVGAGQTLQIWWSVNPTPPEAREYLAYPGAEAEGRTEPHGATLEFQYEDRAFAHHEFISWTRPGRGRLMHLEAVAPGSYEPLACPGEVELATVAITDLAAGRATWKRRPAGNRLVLPVPPAEGDRVRILRLYLELAPLES